MPTGYTALLQDGATFQEYALECARAFGALVTMREDPKGATIPDKFEPSDYHDKGLSDARLKLDTLMNMSGSEKNKAWNLANKKGREDHEEQTKRTKATRDKYEAALKEARAFVAPTPDHEGWRNFMITQIEESIEFDCRERPWVPSALDEWYEAELKSAKWSVDYHTKEGIAEIARCEQRTKWVLDMNVALGIPCDSDSSGILPPSSVEDIADSAGR